MSSYDYIIIGAGSAGCVLATRLSEDANVSVLLIEAGGGKSLFVDMPAGIKVLYTSGRYNWRFWTEPQQHLDNRRIYIPRGKVIGGSSSINSMIAMRCMEGFILCSNNRSYGFISSPSFQSCIHYNYKSDANIESPNIISK